LLDGVIVKLAILAVTILAVALWLGMWLFVGRKTTTARMQYLVPLAVTIIDIALIAVYGLRLL